MTNNENSTSSPGVLELLGYAALDRLRLLRDSVLDLSIVIDDLDQELSARLAERARLDTQLRHAEHELQQLLRRWAA